MSCQLVVPPILCIQAANPAITATDLKSFVTSFKVLVKIYEIDNIKVRPVTIEFVMVATVLVALDFETLVHCWYSDLTRVETVISVHPTDPGFSSSAVSGLE